MNPIDYKKFRVDYRDRIKEKREDNERLKEELQKQIELEAKQEVSFKETLYFIISSQI